MGGGRIGTNHTQMCVSKSEGYFCQPKVNERNENMSFRMGVNFAAGNELCRGTLQYGYALQT